MLSVLYLAGRLHLAHGVRGNGVDTLPEAVGLPHLGLPQPQRPVLRATRVQLAVRAEPDTMHRPEVALEVVCRSKMKICSETDIISLFLTNLDAGLIVVFVQLEILAPTDKNILVLTEGGGVGGAGHGYLLHLLETKNNKYGY